MMRAVLFSIATLFALGLPATAEDGYMVGPVVGEPSPGLEGAEMAVAGDPEFGAGKGRVVAFVRSADWCPYCQAQLKDLENARAPLAEKGWSLAALSYDRSDILTAFADKHDLGYTLLSDEDSSVISAFNLLNTDVPEGSRYWGIPHPAIVFIRNDGEVAAVLRERGYEDRPEVEIILETAARLNEVPAGG